tara:strand:- start:8176 stop:8781 length:606 start_codon:yes stop_codon:yes gene_type:complete
MDEVDTESGSGGAEATTDIVADEGNAEPTVGDVESDATAEGDAGEDTGDDSGNYADFEMPEGLELDTALAEKFNPIMKELGLTQEQAQSLASKMAEHVQAQGQGQRDAYSQQLDSWNAASKADKEIGGDNFDESVGLAQYAVDKLGTPELKTVLNDYGVGSNPEIIRAFTRMGRLLKEDSAGSGQPSRVNPDRETIMYPTK